ncbi:hypothetical protein BDZ94DRAFT_1232793 [Collybia nuda]|uniref:Uncharacterized protein n=1 Tax=Collybia nuda TaxID=64659 RepID=A0A9P5YFD1_9AGAR|nr:hypothetical protein BDZ94DRAFT_1232793 [Collybia nuda]
MSCNFTTLYILLDPDWEELAHPLATFKTFTQLFFQHPARLTLTTLKITSQEMIVTNIRHAPDAYSALEPLFACPALQDINIKLRLVDKLDDSWLKGAAASWPALRRLNIKTLHSTISEMTLAGFIPVLRNCPDLHSLGFSIHATPVDPNLLRGVGNILVKKISVGSSTIQSPARVVRSLIGMFPSLWDVTPRGAEGPGWSKVQKLLQLMGPEESWT